MMANNHGEQKKNVSRYIPAINKLAAGHHNNKNIVLKWTTDGALIYWFYVIILCHMAAKGAEYIRSVTSLSPI